MANTKVFTVSELTEYLKTIVAGKKIRIIGEVSQPTIRGGHLYFNLKDESSNIKSIIFKSKNIPKDDITDGLKLTLDCKLDYYGGTGNINLIVDKIITNDGDGELFIKYEKIKLELISKGYFDKSNKKSLPSILKNILIITSQDGAALQDFIFNLNNNKSLIKYDIIDVKVQGFECPKNICDILNNWDSNLLYDLVVITRGGGSFSDLFGFSQPELIESVFNFHLPILSAIGHQIDNPLLDLVADYSAPTPSLASQFIVDHNKNYLNNLDNIKENFKINILNDLTNQQLLIAKLDEKINKQFYKLESIKNQIQNSLITQLNQLVIKLTILDTKINIHSNPFIELFNLDSKIYNTETLDILIGKKIKLKWGNHEYKIKLINKNY